MAEQRGRKIDRPREWRSSLAIWVGGLLAFETLTGLAIYFLPFSVPNQLMVLLHTVIGLIWLIPFTWYQLRHWLLYRPFALTHLKLTGYLTFFTILVCGVSGLVLTWQAALGTRISYAWDLVHLISTFAIIAFAVPHIVLIVLRDRKALRAGTEAPPLRDAVAAAKVYGWGTLRAMGVGFALVLVGLVVYRPVRLHNAFPADYSWRYGKKRPFAPSLARTETGGAIDARLFAGSRSCGTSGCHEQILEEWLPSAHRYAALDKGFQAIQLTMAKQNGHESTRYCGGCHDPISLFSGTKNIFTDEEKLTSLHGFREGVSCLACHEVRTTDLKGNANYIIAKPRRYLGELEFDGTQSRSWRFVRDFLIRAYPRHHVNALSKRLFKAPEYCAACHKQFVDKEVNQVGWVQLQNQYDNWRKSKWNHPKNPRKTIECRECHMPLVASRDPAAGDSLDYNRSPNDGKHRSHRFIGANQFIPALQKLEGWETQVALTEKWLRGEFDIPEIADKWAKGPVVGIELAVPEKVSPGEEMRLQAILTSNKVGHDFPTGPLDIIQAWVELTVKDDAGKVLFASGTVDKKHFIKPGSFMFKAEPVDQHGNLIDRHNLWEMVGVRYRRSLFPGFADTAEYAFRCPGSYTTEATPPKQEKSFQFRAPAGTTGKLHITAKLHYRKIDQFLLNFMRSVGFFKEFSDPTSPITEMARDEATVEVVPPPTRVAEKPHRAAGS